MNCKNCEQEFTGDFCNHCGQKSTVSRLDFAYLRNEIATGIFQVDRGFLFTVKEMLTRPGHSIRAFIEGKRKNHFKPLSFLLVAVTLYIISNKFFGNGTFVNDFVEGFKAGGELANGSGEEKAITWIKENQANFILFTMLVFSTASYLAFFKARYNLIEHLVLNLYITGFQFIIYTVFSFVVFDPNSPFILIPLLLGFIYNIWTYTQFFHEMPIGRKLGLMVLTYFLFTVGFVLLFAGMLGLGKLLE